jgi:hypothetical protein
MQVTLNIPNQSAWKALQPLMQYLRIEIIEFKENSKKKDEKPSALKFIKARSQKEQEELDNLVNEGCTIADIDNFMLAFEESNHDRVLPFQNLNH